MYTTFEKNKIKKRRRKYGIRLTLGGNIIKKKVKKILNLKTE